MIQIDSLISETLKNIFQNQFFNFYFLNVDIFLIIKITNLKFYMHIKNITVERTVSQNFDVGPGLSLRKSRKNIQKNK